jgi:hypothetical protein
MMRHARTHYPQVRFHAWGQAGRTYLDALPVYSADSSRSAVAYRYGLLRLFDPATGRQHNVPHYRKHDIMRHGRLLREVYGVDPHTIRNSDASNRHLLIRLAATGTQLYAAWLRERHGEISAPVWAVRGTPPAGTLIHNVSANAKDYAPLLPEETP